MSHLENIPKIRRMEAGQDPNEDPVKSLTVEEFVEAVKRGDIDPISQQPKPGSQKALSADERLRYEKMILEKLGFGGKKQFNLPPVPVAYGQRRLGQ